MSLVNRLRSDVSYLGYVPTRDLGKIYGLASLFVYPSLYEGFGLPPLEAMACGCPTIVSRAASLAEVCGEAAFYINPYEVGTICEGMEHILTDRSLQDTLRRKGLERAKIFSWQKAAWEHLKVFKRFSSS